MSRPAKPALSEAGLQAFAQFERHLLEEEELSDPTLRNYLSDMHQFMAWWENSWRKGEGFTPAAVETPAIACYRSYLETVAQLKPATINRYLSSLKRYFAWATDVGLTSHDPAKDVKLMEQEQHAPRCLTDEEENALIAAVTASGNLRDRTLITLMLHTGLRPQEVCHLKRDDVQTRKQHEFLRVCGRHNKYREVPLNATARAVLADYLQTLPEGSVYLFPSEKTGEGITERALGYVVGKYACQAGLADVSPHCLRHRFGYRMAEHVPLQELAQIMGHDSLNTTMVYMRKTMTDLQTDVEKIAWR